MKSYKNLKQKLVSIIPTVQEAMKCSDGSQVQFGTTNVTFAEAEAMLAEFQRVAEANEVVTVNKSIIPMNLLATNYFFRDIQESLNKIN